MAVLSCNVVSSRLATEAGWTVLVEDDGECPLIGYPQGEDATAFAVWTEADPERLVCVDLSTETHTRITLMTAPGADPDIVDAFLEIKEQFRIIALTYADSEEERRMVLPL